MSDDAELPAPAVVLPQRPPFLFIDRVTACNEVEVRAVRTFRPDEDYFRGHFPDRPIVPGVLILEAMAQTFGYYGLVDGGHAGVVLTGIDRARFRKPVLPGHTVEFHVQIEGARMGLVRGKATALVNGEKVADAVLTGRFVTPDEMAALTETLTS